MIIKKQNNSEDYYVCRSKHKTFIEEKRGIFLVKPTIYSGKVDLHTISFSKNWIGKRVRFKIEVVKNDKSGRDGLDRKISSS